METTIQQVIERAATYGLKLQVWFSSPRLLESAIGSHRIQKPGLALAGFLQNVHPNRVQIFGESEISYLRSLSEPDARRSVAAFCQLRPVMIVCTKGLEPPEVLLASCRENGVAIVGTDLASSLVIDQITNILADLIAEKDSLHGVMVDVFGVGLLMLGESGVGKSETGLDLVLRGHRLIADDIVEVRRRPGGALIASSPKLTRHHMEVRGLGIINVKELYGISAVREHKRVEMLVELFHWNRLDDIDRLGLSREQREVLGASLPLIRLPVTPGRDIAGIVEVAARDHLLRLEGIDSAERFQEQVAQEISISSRLHSAGNEVE